MQLKKNILNDEQNKPNDWFELDEIDLDFIITMQIQYKIFNILKLSPRGIVLKLCLQIISVV